MTLTAVQQPDLFGASLTPAKASPPSIPGLRLLADFIGAEDEAALIESIDDQQLTPFKFQQWEGKRLTTSFGWDYDFTVGGIATAPPMPDWLVPIRDRAADFAGLSPDALVQALLIRYDPGAGIGWHRDRPVFGHVVGISLGNSATMRFRRRRDGGFGRANEELDPRSIYHLSGEARHAWEHSITPMDMPRWSITLRSLA
ncbi:alpha-ketoglutarate-dependent dioxygenase AlkB [Sphingomonas sp.]|uniref:alpha-ketoglutarate-dependent dioxygenase AlkB n=1 Tax=Sphingomonas sp. TaxID=28214 RepID=UPI002DD644CA|nr:alpha-ketoglutarate-dependent dioxygenase AlkB [Sphingomonas sp.]